MRYCKKCVQPDTRPDIEFTEDGACMACWFAEQDVNWVVREAELAKIVTEAKSQAFGAYDCAVGVSGGKDSTVQAVYARDVLGLRTLLVNGASDWTTDVGKQNLSNLVRLGFDLISLQPNPIIQRKLVRRSFFEYGNLIKPTEYSLYASAWLIAESFGIPLVIQGENPAVTLGITKTLEVTGDASSIVGYHTLAENYLSWGSGDVVADDLYLYKLPSRGGPVTSVYLGYYMKEWSHVHNTELARRYGLRGRPGHEPLRTGRLNPYTSVDSDMQIVNQMLKYYKFGFGTVTDEVCHYIRGGLISRETGIELVNRYDGKCAPSYILEFCDYIGIGESEFWKVVGTFKNDELFTDYYSPRFEVGRL